MKNILVIIAVSAMFIPLTTNAAWWNPLSWFQPHRVTIVQSDTVPESDITSPVKPELLQVLSGRSEKLEAENSSLKQQVKQLTQKEIYIDVTPVKSVIPSDGLTQGQRNDKRIQELTIQISDLESSSLSTRDNGIKYCLKKYELNQESARQACVDNIKNIYNESMDKAEVLKTDKFNLETGKTNL